MMTCAFCPETRFKQLKGGKYVSWTNPIACRTPYDVVRDCKAHVNATRGWHKFWYAVHALARLLPGLEGGGAAGAAGGGAVSDAGHVEQCRLWLVNKAPDWYSNRGDFERAGLLADGGEGEPYGIPVKFMLADALLARYCGPHVEFWSKTTEKGSNSKESRAVSTKAGSASVDVNCDESERVKLELNVGQAKDLSWIAAAGASQHHSLPLPSTALGSASDAVLADNFSNFMSEQEIESFLSSRPFSDAGAAGPPDVFPSQTPDLRTLERHDFIAPPLPIYDSDIDGRHPMDSMRPATSQIDVSSAASGGVVNDGVDNDGGLPMHSERYSALQVYPPYGTYADRRPVVNLLLDLMSSVGFDTQVCFTYKHTSTYPLSHMCYMCCVFGSIQHMNTTHLSSNS